MDHSPSFKQRRLEFLMISSVLALALASAAQASVPVPQARADFASCLSTQVRRSLDAKHSADQFEAALQQSCADKQAVFVRSVVAADVRNGVPRAAAEQMVREEVEEYLLNARESHRDHSAAGTRPSS
jgi:hypothetical protein